MPQRLNTCRVYMARKIVYMLLIKEDAWLVIEKCTMFKEILTKLE